MIGTTGRLVAGAVAVLAIAGCELLYPASSRVAAPIPYTWTSEDDATYVTVPSGPLTFMWAAEGCALRVWWITGEGQVIRDVLRTVNVAGSRVVVDLPHGVGRPGVLAGCVLRDGEPAPWSLTLAP